MTDYGLFTEYGTAIGGRERQALRVYAELIGHLNGLTAMGEIEGIEMVQLQPHGGTSAASSSSEAGRSRSANCKAARNSSASSTAR